MPRKPLKSSADTINSLRAHGTDKQRLDNVEQQLTKFVQWHEELGDSVEELKGRVGNLEDEFKEVKQDLGKLSTQLHEAANTSRTILESINNCLVGTEHMGIKRPGLCDDVKQLSTDLGEVRTMVSINAERLSSIERFRATLVWAGGGVSTVITAIAFWAWAHTDQILATVSNIYGRATTEAAHPQAGSAK